MMAYKLDIKPTFDADLQLIFDYCERERIPAPIRLLTKVIERIKALEDMPRGGRKCDYDDRFRQVVVNPYIVFYYVDEEKKAVEVHHVWDGRRNLEKLFHTEINLFDRDFDLEEEEEFER